MKRILIVAALGALLVAPAVTAQTSQPGEVRVSATAPRMVQPGLGDLWYDEFDTIKGDYALSNGKAMRLGMWGNRMYASIDGMPRTQLIALSPYAFVSRDRQLRIVVDDPSLSSSTRLNAMVTMPARLAGIDAAPGELLTLVAKR
jgi:opacity protein-like surface antigen